MTSCDASRTVQCNIGNFDSFRLLSIKHVKNGLGLPRMLCDVTCFQLDLVMILLLLQERVMPVFLTNFIQVN